MELKAYKAEDIQLFFKRYDLDKDGTLKFSEFSNAFAPKDESISAYLFERKPEDLTKPVKEYMFSYRFKKAFQETMASIVSGEKEHATLKQELRDFVMSEH